MHAQWKQHADALDLPRGGLHSHSEVVVGAERDWVVDLSDTGILRVSGSDAQAFLQGQLTSDVRDLTPGTMRIGAWCSPKGRVLAIFRILQPRPSEYWLQLVGSHRVATLLPRLRMFVLRAQVDIDDISDEQITIGCQGRHMPDALQGCLGGTPRDVGGVIRLHEAVVVRLPGDAPRFQIIAPFERMCSVWDSLAKLAKPVGPADWRLADIRSGLTGIYDETADEFLPQMLNLVELGAVDFEKGCYVGQEIVARAYYRGKVKRGLYAAHTDARSAPLHAARIVTTDTAASAGHIADVAPSPRGGYELLAVINVEQANASALAIDDPSGSTLRVHQPRAQPAH